MIRIEGLRVRAGGFRLAIDELTVATGEYLMVLGPTASGKTMLLEAIAGLRRLEAGRVWFGSAEVTEEPPERRRVGLVYQDYALFPHLTVEENIGFGLGRRDRERVTELASLLGIRQLLTRYPEGLSGGEQQRVALARALAVEPELLLLDEPLSALDGPTRLELQRELKRLHGDLGATVVQVTHDLDEATSLGDRMAVLIAGQLRQVGSPDEVIRLPADAQVAALVGIGNIFPVAEVRDAADGWHRLVRLETGHELLAHGTAGECPAHAARGLWAAVRGEEIGVEAAVERAAEQTVFRPGGSDDSHNAGDGPMEQVNVLAGIVRAVQLQSVQALIEVEVPSRAGTAPLVVSVNVLRPQASRMELAAGSPVVLRIPARALHMCPDAEPPDVAMGSERPGRGPRDAKGRRDVRVRGR